MNIRNSIRVDVAVAATLIAIDLASLFAVALWPMGPVALLEALTATSVSLLSILYLLIGASVIALTMGLAYACTFVVVHEDAHATRSASK